jgi:hypothetical protein
LVPASVVSAMEVPVAMVAASEVTEELVKGRMLHQTHLLSTPFCELCWTSDGTDFLGER